MPPFTTRPELIGTFGMVASSHWLAAQSGMAALEAGGNAFDAAVAAGLVLQVVEPHLNGPGGEVPILLWDQRSGSASVVAGQGGAPAVATIDAFADLGLDLIPGTGMLPACVPGAFGAWMLMLRRWGTLRLRDVLSYAIGYAANGYPVLPGIARALGYVSDLFAEHWPTSAAAWLANGGTPAVGTMMRSPGIAATYTRILTEAESASSDRDGQIEAARAAFYQGFVAEAIDRFAAGSELMDVSGRPHRGLISGSDLAAWQPRVEAPVSIDYQGLTVCKPGPWTQGPVMLQQLRLLQAVGAIGPDPSSAQFVHAVVECAKLAFADREAYYGDPLYVDVPMEDLLSKDYATTRSALVTDTAWTDGLRPGNPAGRVPRLPRYPSSTDYPSDAALGVVPQAPPPTERGRVRGDTCHVDVVDRFGNMVVATPSGGWLQSSPAVDGLGFSLGTRGEMFWLQEGLANSLAPGKRPRTTLSPTLVLADGRPYLGFGTPGGDQQDQWPLLFFLRHVDYRMNLQEAIDAPAWHTTHVPSSFYPRRFEPGGLHIEDRIAPAEIVELTRRGHAVTVEGPWSLGHTTAASRGADGVLRAAASPRAMQAYAVGR